MRFNHTNESLDIIKQESFISTWELLAKESQEFTIIQEHGLVVSWYQAYQEQYDPIIVLAYDDKENIIAILPLAICIEDSGISHAGHQQAEYNGWICKKDIEEEFLIESLILLKKEFSLEKWGWGWMPPHANTDWLQSDKLKQNQIFVNVNTYSSPFYDLSDTARVDKIKKSKALKSKINRLKRSGDLRIERITDLTAAKKIFTDLKKIANFRNLAVYDNLPFEGESNPKEQWHLNHLNRSKQVHFTVLWQGDELLACNFGYCSDDTVIIGLFTYNPVQGAHSPGNVFLIQLIEFITNEGYKYLDLSPGGDPYKERFSNLHHTITKPVFSFSKVSKYKTDAFIFLKNKVKEKYSYRDIFTLKKKISTLLNMDKNDSELFKKAFTEEDLHHKETTIAHQKFDDLLLYKDNDGYKKQSDIIFSALKNFERTDSLYTIVQNNELIFFTWISISGKKHWDSKVNESVNISGKDILLYDTYFVEGKTEKEDLHRFISQIISNYSDLSSTVYFVKPLSVNSETIKEIGFSPVSVT